MRLLKFILITFFKLSQKHQNLNWSPKLRKYSLSLFNLLIVPQIILLSIAFDENHPKIPPYAVYNSAPTQTIEFESNKFLLRTLNPFVINLYRSFIVLLWWLGETIEVWQGFASWRRRVIIVVLENCVTNDLIFFRPISLWSIPGLFHMFHWTFGELIIHKLQLLFVCYSDTLDMSRDDPTLMMWIINFFQSNLFARS